MWVCFKCDSCYVVGMDTPVNRFTITDAAKRFNVSRATLLRRAKAETLKRNNDGTFDINVLIDAGYMKRDSDVSNTPHDAHETSHGTPQVEVFKDVIDSLQKQLETSQDEKAQLLKQLDQAQALLLQEQQNIQRLLTAGTPAPRKGFRDKLRQWWEGIQQTPEG